LPIGLVLIGITASIASFESADPTFDNELALVALVTVTVTRLWQRRWSWMGAQLFATASLAAIAYLLFAGQLTFETVRGLIYVVASAVLLLLEIAALSLSASYLFEIIEALARKPQRQHQGDPSFLPKVALQVPAYNEPMEVVAETLKSLAAID